MHGLDDVAALAHAAEHRLDIVGELPFTGAGLLGKTETSELLQPTRAERLAEGIAGYRARSTMP